jgi:hypothetical protein
MSSNDLLHEHVFDIPYLTFTMPMGGEAAM